MQMSSLNSAFDFDQIFDGQLPLVIDDNFIISEGRPFVGVKAVSIGCQFLEPIGIQIAIFMLSLIHI